MNTHELDILTAEINSLYEEYTSRHETCNNYYNPLKVQINKKMKFYNWVVIYMVVGFLGTLYLAYYLYFTQEFTWYYSIIPAILALGFLIFLFIKRNKVAKERKRILKEWQKAIDEINVLEETIKRNSDIAVEMMLDSFLDDRQEVIRIIGTSYHDLLEYYIYYQDYIYKHPNSKPTIKRIKDIKYDFERILTKDKYTDDEIILSLVRDINKENIVEIIHLINNYNLNYRLKIVGFVLSFLYNYNFNKNFVKKCYDLLTINIDDKTISGFNFFACLRDNSYYNVRQYKKYLQAVDHSTIYYEIMIFLHRNKVYNINNHRDKALIFNCIVKLFYRFREELSKYEVNAFISLIYSIDLAFNEALIKQYYKLYNLNFSVLEDSALINIYQKLVLVNLYLNDFEKASSYLDRIEGKDKNNLFMLTNRVLVKYKINNFPLLFKKYKYSSMPEFIAIEERVSLLKNFDLINDLYNFKHKYLGYRVK